jgi:hypothetical protein
MNRNWTENPEIGTITRDYSDPAGPVPTVTGTISRAEGIIWWNLTVTSGRDRWGNPKVLCIASGQAADTPHALAVVKGRVTRLGRAAAYLERQTATERVLAELNAAIEAAGTVTVADAPTKYLRECAWQRDMAAARLEKLTAAA